jgi:antitoxin HicB
MESEMARTPEYPFEVRPLTAEEGGGYLISFPDFTDCVSDGATVDEAIENGRLALKETIAALREAGQPVPEPTAATTASGKFVARVPKSVHAKLSSRARAEGVSLNTLVVSLLSEGLGKKSAQA